MFQFYRVDLSRVWSGEYDYGLLVVLIENLLVLPKARVHALARYEGAAMPGWGYEAEILADMFDLRLLELHGRNPKSRGEAPVWSGRPELKNKNKPKTISEFDVDYMHRLMFPERRP